MNTTKAFFFRLRTNIHSRYRICEQCFQPIEKRSIVLATVKELRFHSKELILYHKDCGLLRLNEIKKAQSEILATLSNALINVKDSKSPSSHCILEKEVRCPECHSSIELKEPMYKYPGGFQLCQACAIKEIQAKIAEYQAHINYIDQLISELDLNLIPSLKLRQLKTYSGGQDIEFN